MGLSGKLVSETCIKSDGDVFHELFKEKPHTISGITPQKIQNCQLHEGEWGKVGSLISWNYFHDGKERVAKEVIDAIDEEKKLVTFKIIGGDLLEKYKAIAVTVHVETKGEDNLVVWTIDYEKLNDDIEEPLTLLGLCIHLTKDIENHHLTSN